MFSTSICEFFSNDSLGYSYSKQKTKSKKLTYNLQNEDLVNEKVASNFNGILINKYQNGNDSIGKHSDDETGLAPQGVVSISWGASENLELEIKKWSHQDYLTQNNEILVMSGDFQKQFTHEYHVKKSERNTIFLYFSTAYFLENNFDLK